MRARAWLGVILLLYLLLTLAYGALNPLFEAPDEHWHYFTAQYIADEGALPAVAPGDAYDPWLSQEAAQPPLYYLTGAALIAPIDTAGAREAVWLNKFASVGDAGALLNVNRFIHTTDEAWPWQGYALAAHVLRIFSTLLGLGTLLCIYGSGRLLWPGKTYRPLLATALTAFLPQFNFLHAAISNDTLIIFLASAALWQLIRLWQVGVTRGRLLLLGVTLGLAALSKNAGVLLLAYAVGVLVLLAWRERERFGWRLLRETAVFVLLPALLLAGWLWLRNWQLYGDLTATEPFIRIAGGDRNYSLWRVLGESDGLWLSLFAVFGWFNLRPPQWIYWFWNGVAALGGLGLLWRAWRGRRENVDRSDFWHRPWLLPALLGLWVALVYAGLVAFMMRTEAAQGRLLFPAIVPLALGVAAGWTAARWLRRLSLLLPLLALLTSVYALLYVIRPAYTRPPLLDRVPTAAAVFGEGVGQGLRLEGAQVETETAAPGDSLWLTLYWQAGIVPEEPPELVVSVFGRGTEEIGKVHSYHGRGLYPATLWPPGRIVGDRFGLRLEEEVAAPVLAQIDVSLAQGEESVRAGQVKIVPDVWPEAVEPVLARLGETVELMAVDATPAQPAPGETVTLAVQWRVAQAPGVDLTTLVHLGQPDQPPLATGDRPPLAGDYPTRVWAAGEVINDQYVLALPTGLRDGRYPIWIGMYDPQTMARLPLTVDGERQPFDVYLAGWVELGAQ